MYHVHFLGIHITVLRTGQKKKKSLYLNGSCNYLFKFNDNSHKITHMFSDSNKIKSNA